MKKKIWILLAVIAVGLILGFMLTYLNSKGV